MFMIILEIFNLFSDKNLFIKDFALKVKSFGRRQRHSMTVIQFDGCIIRRIPFFWSGRRWRPNRSQFVWSSPRCEKFRNAKPCWFGTGVCFGRKSAKLKSIDQRWENVLFYQSKAISRARRFYSRHLIAYPKNSNSSPTLSLLKKVERRFRA